eukprot:CAMPEP_0197847940 /NCGR_PEP_ID=MMETSP1438-20131217/7567_1 /TAXON_ID=1461541 /ORGANISM="Pterosperma sp., Strain CCMP1384" /LENGTH=78 /DNA_ID=CAMNT_0043460023 /DNA_START=92 /DNA_END=328 /DNA_ORIENTATION=+
MNFCAMFTREDKLYGDTQATAMMKEESSRLQSVKLYFDDSLPKAAHFQYNVGDSEHITEKSMGRHSQFQTKANLASGN